MLLHYTGDVQIDGRMQGEDDGFLAAFVTVQFFHNIQVSILSEFHLTGLRRQLGPLYTLIYLHSRHFLSAYDTHKPTVLLMHLHYVVQHNAESLCC